MESQRFIAVKYHNRDLTKEDIKKILEHADLRDRTFFLLMAESGLRPSTLVRLRYSNIKKEFEAGIVPMKIELQSNILKDKVSAHFNFIGEDGYKLLKEYLSLRKDISDNDLIFEPERPNRMKGSSLGAETFGVKFSDIILKTGLEKPTEYGKPKALRLYGLRKYFFNNMRCDSAFRNYWFGHKTIDEHYITTNDLERHREEYSKGYESLRVYDKTPTEQIVAKQAEELEKLKQENSLLQQRVSDLQMKPEERDAIYFMTKMLRTNQTKEAFEKLLKEALRQEEEEKKKQTKQA